MPESIYITGCGVVSALGIGQQELQTGLLQGRSALNSCLHHISTVHNIPCAEVFPSYEELRETMQLPDIPYTRASLMGIMAAREAVANAALKFDGHYRVAFVSSTSAAGMDKMELYYGGYLKSKQHVPYIALYDAGAVTDAIASMVGSFDFVTTNTAAGNSSANAIHMAIRMIQMRYADIVVVGGTDALTRYHINGFSALGMLSHEVCRPFDARHNGLNVGEGAAYLVLENETTVKRRFVQPLVKLSAAVSLFQPQMPVNDSAHPIYTCMKQALEQAALHPENIDYINAHATGLPSDDRAEAQAIMAVFGAEYPLTSSTKGAVGHTVAADAALQLLITADAIQHDFIPPNLHFTEPMEELNAFVPIATAVTNHPLENALINTAGMGGYYSSFILSKVN